MTIEVYEFEADEEIEFNESIHHLDEEDINQESSTTNILAELERIKAKKQEITIIDINALQELVISSDEKFEDIYLYALDPITSAHSFRAFWSTIAMFTVVVGFLLTSAGIYLVKMPLLEFGLVFLAITYLARIKSEENLEVAYEKKLNCEMKQKQLWNEFIAKSGEILAITNEVEVEDEPAQ